MQLLVSVVVGWQVRFLQVARTCREMRALLQRTDTLMKCTDLGAQVRPTHRRAQAVVQRKIAGLEPLVQHQGSAPGAATPALSEGVVGEGM